MVFWSLTVFTNVGMVTHTLVTLGDIVVPHGESACLARRHIRHHSGEPHHCEPLVLCRFPHCQRSEISSKHGTSSLSELPSSPLASSASSFFPRED